MLITVTVCFTVFTKGPINHRNDVSEIIIFQFPLTIHRRQHAECKFPALRAHICRKINTHVIAKK